MTREIDLDYKLDFDATGPNVIVQLDPPQDLELNGQKIDGKEKKTDWGFILDEEEVDFEMHKNLADSAVATVVSIGPCAFHRDGLTDMLDSVKVGTRVVYKRLHGDTYVHQGKNTLYQLIQEHHIQGIKK